MKTNVKAPPTHVTHEGAPAKRITLLAELRRTVCACLLWEDTFYENGVAVAQRIRDLVAALPPEDVIAVATSAREDMKLRHVPLLLVRELARHKVNVAAVLERVIQRPDELTEFLSLYWLEKRQPLAASVKRGLAAAFQKFNAYGLAKYNRDGAVKLRDVLFLTHAKPKDAEQAAIWKQLVDGALPTPDTWEVALSAGGDKRAIWTRLLSERKLGALALLRNLRNMQAAQVDVDLIKAALRDCDPERVLPFRFVAAARFAPRVEPELEALMFKCLEGKSKLPGKTVLLVDRSGSMESTISTKSDLTRYDAACALAMLLREMCEDVAVLTFASPDMYRVGDRAQPNHVKTIPARRGFALRDAMGRPGGGTYTEDGKRAADAEGYDRLILITDEQSHQALSNPKGRGYVVNVASYQHGVGYGAWTHIDGWSEAVVDYIQTAEAVEVQ